MEYEIHFTVIGMKQQQVLTVDADDVRTADAKLDDYVAFHDVRIAHVQSIVPRAA
jgi:hypothetical protein